MTATKLGFDPAAATSPSTPAVLARRHHQHRRPGRLRRRAGRLHPQPPRPAPGTPPRTTLAYQWTADGVPVAGATTPTFTPGPDEVGKAIAVTVTATRAGYIDVAAPSVATQAGRARHVHAAAAAVAVGAAHRVRPPAARPDASPSTPVRSRRPTPTSRSSGCAAASRSRGDRYDVPADRGRPRPAGQRPGHGDQAGLHHARVDHPATARAKAVPHMALTLTAAPAGCGCTSTSPRPGVTAVPGVRPGPLRWCTCSPRCSAARRVGVGDADRT